jgi:hypothetical protein
MTQRQLHQPGRIRATSIRAIPCRTGAEGSALPKNRQPEPRRRHNPNVLEK